jgi:hypothetical protein
MIQETTRERIGAYSGLLFLVLMGIGIPLLIILDPSFSTNPKGFDPLSKLSQSEQSKYYYMAIHIFSGILALLYFELHFFPSRPLYDHLANKKLAVISARIGAIGQIALGIFARGLFPFHLFAAAAFAIGYVSCFVFISFNLDNQLNSTEKFSKLIVLGYLSSIIALMNTLYFRYSNIRGIWQFFVIISGMAWYIYEARIYSQNKADFKNGDLVADTPSEIKNVIYLMVGFGIYLLIFSYLLYSRPKMWPWECTENDETCQLPNVMALAVAGVILLLYSLYYVRSMKAKLNSKTEMKTALS